MDEKDFVLAAILYVSDKNHRPYKLIKIFDWIAACLLFWDNL